MLSGKAVARAVRGYLLVDAALSALLIAKTLDIDIPNEEPPQETHNWRH